MLALANDLVTRDKTSEVKKLFARRKNLLVPDDLTGIFLKPCTRILRMRTSSKLDPNMASTPRCKPRLHR